MEKCMKLFQVIITGLLIGSIPAKGSAQIPEMPKASGNAVAAAAVSAINQSIDKNDNRVFDLRNFPPGSILSSAREGEFEIASMNIAETVQAVFDPEKALALRGEYSLVTMPMSERHFPENYKNALVEQGIAHVRYNLQNGPIAKGDHITISSEPGVGMKATESGFTIGVALENSDATEKPGLIRVRVMVRYERF